MRVAPVRNGTTQAVKRAHGAVDRAASGWWWKAATKE